MLGDVGSVPAGLMGAVSFGAGDFAGGRAALRISGIAAVAVAQLVAAVTAVTILTLVDGTFPAGSQSQFAALAGVCHVTAVYFLYQGMAHGRVSVVAPIAGVVGIGIPVVADFGFFEMASAIHCAGITLSVLAIYLFSQSSTDDDDSGKTGYSVRAGIISGLGFGLADLFLGLMTTATAEGGLAIARITGASLAVGLVLTQVLAAWRPQPTVMGAVAPRADPGTPLLAWDRNLKLGLALCALAGFLDCLGQLGYVLSATQGQMSIAAALTAMYPAVAVGLAVWLLQEKIGEMQWAGLAATFAGIALLAQ